MNNWRSLAIGLLSFLTACASVPVQSPRPADPAVGPADRETLPPQEETAAEERPEPDAQPADPPAAPPAEATGLPKNPEEETAPNLVADYLAALSERELIGQLLMVTLVDQDGQWITGLDDETARWLADAGPGGVIFFQHNIRSTEQTVTLINDLQAAVKIPMIIAIDHEGGIVNRLKALPSSAISLLPSAMEVGRTEDGRFARMLAKYTARELRAFGFTMNMAPVADVRREDTSSVIGPRSFGSSPLLVSRMVENYVIGMQSENLSAVVKHFPGHGAAKVDSHLALPVVEAELEDLESVDLLPFRRGIDAGADAVMVAHISYPQIGSAERPASTDGAIVTDLLRGEMGFRGLVITDSLGMNAASENQSYRELVIRALRAGIDMLLQPTDVGRTIDIIQEAISDGSLSRQQLEESAHRVLLIKVKRGMMRAADGTLVPSWTPGEVGEDNSAAASELLRSRFENDPGEWSGGFPKSKS